MGFRVLQGGDYLAIRNPTKVQDDGKTHMRHLSWMPAVLWLFEPVQLRLDWRESGGKEPSLARLQTLACATEPHANELAFGHALEAVRLKFLKCSNLWLPTHLQGSCGALAI